MGWNLTESGGNREVGVGSNGLISFIGILKVSHECEKDRM